MRSGRAWTHWAHNPTIHHRTCRHSSGCLEPLPARWHIAFMVITPEQIRAARALLRMDQDELARRAHVSVVTVRRLEAGASKVAPQTADEVCRTLEAAGAEFIEHGVRRRKRTPEELEARYRAIMEIAERSAAKLKDAPPFTEDDLYDENGLPA
ncbi:MAG TPA: helix-turn-helix transcriptional regulator [Acetobacteraceae bacterium]